MTKEKQRVVAVFTGNRSEYGVLVPVLRRLEASPALAVKLIVSGAHLDPKFGLTLDEIARDRFTIAGTVPMKRTDDTVSAMARAAGEVTRGVAGLLPGLKPDFFLVIGDRSETLAAATAAFLSNVPVVHISGGDVARGGALDDSIRHAISRLAHLHFTTNEEARRRLIRMGEEPWRVHFAGSPTLDSVVAADYATREEVARDLNLDLTRPILVFTQHPVTTEPEAAGAQVRESLAALREAGHQTVLTYPNNDAGADAIIAQLEAVKLVPHFRVRQSLGRHLYLGLLTVASAMVGNSSSGVIESPMFRIPAIDIGTRQLDRLRAGNVLTVGYDRKVIRAAIEKALTNKPFRAKVKKCRNPYGRGRAGEKIATVLAEVALGKKLLQKRITY